MIRDESFSLLPEVRLKGLFLHLSYTMAFAVIFPVAMIDSYCQNIHILKQGGFFLFLDSNRILDLIGKSLIISIAEHIISPTQLRDIVYQVHIVSGNLITRLHAEIVQHVSCFTNEIQETKMSMQLINKQVLVREPVLQDTLVFLVEVYLKLVLGYSSEINHYKVYFCNICVKLHWISMEIQTTLKQKIIELVRLSTAEDVGDMGFSSPCISIGARNLIRIKCVSKLAKYIG